MKRSAAARLFVGLLLLLVASCGRTDLLSAYSDADFGTGVAGSGGTTGGVLGGGAVSNTGGTVSTGGTVYSGGAGGTRGGTAGEGAAGGRGGAPTAGSGSLGGRGGNAGKGPTAGKGGGAGKPPLLHCGNGVLDPGEECDGGDGPYAHPAIELRSNGIVISLDPVLGSETAEAFYDYRDESSHTGNENVAGSKIYFYREYAERRVSLIVHHGIDFAATGFVQPDGRVKFSISELPAMSVVSVSDDDGECSKDTSTSVFGAWEFGQNTDGCVIGSIPFPGDWHIFVQPSFIEGIDSFTALSGDGYRTGLALAETVELIASDEPGGCRRDCTLPRCGDGRLDAGELCDDGNDEFLDGCTKCEYDYFDTLPPPR